MHALVGVVLHSWRAKGRLEGAGASWLRGMEWPTAAVATVGKFGHKVLGRLEAKVTEKSVTQPRQASVGSFWPASRQRPHCASYRHHMREAEAVMVAIAISHSLGRCGHRVFGLLEAKYTEKFVGQPRQASVASVGPAVRQRPHSASYRHHMREAKAMTVAIATSRSLGRHELRCFQVTDVRCPARCQPLPLTAARGTLLVALRRSVDWKGRAVTSIGQRWVLTPCGLRS